MKHFTKEHFKQMKWKNGGGSTVELYQYTPPGYSEYQLRLSVATVQGDGPFSSFPFFDRTLLILNGPGCSLEVNGANTRLNPDSAPFIFKGEDTVNCIPAGEPFQDFNVMVNRNWGNALVQKKPSEKSFKNSEDLLFLFYPQSFELFLLDKNESIMSTSSEVILVTIKIKPA